MKTVEILEAMLCLKSKSLSKTIMKMVKEKFLIMYLKRINNLRLSIKVVKVGTTRIY